MASALSQLAAIDRELRAATQRVRRYRELPESALQQRPSAGAWSAIECVRHLNLTSTAYLPILDDALARAPGLKRDAGYRQGVVGGLLAWTLMPPSRMKTKTAPAFVPGGETRCEDVLSEFEQLQEALGARVARCQARDLGRVKVVSPFNARVTYNLYAALTILTAHQRRHLWQADRALAAVAGAGSPRT